MSRFRGHLILFIILTLAAAVEIGTAGCKESGISTGDGKAAIGGGSNAAIPVSQDGESSETPHDGPGMSAPPVDIPTPITGRILVTSPDERGEVFIIGEEGAVAANSVVLIMKEADEVEPHSLLNFFIRPAYGEEGGDGEEDETFSPICYKPQNKCVRANEFGAFRIFVIGTTRDRFKITQILSSGNKDDTQPKLDVGVIKEVPKDIHPFAAQRPVDLAISDNQGELAVLLRGKTSSPGKIINNAVDTCDPMTVDLIKQTSTDNGTKDATELLLTESYLYYTDTPEKKSNIYNAPASKTEAFQFFNTFKTILPPYSFIGTHIIEAPAVNLFDTILMVGPNGHLLARPLDNAYQTVEYVFPFDEWNGFSKIVAATRVINRGSCLGEDVVGVIHETMDAKSAKRYVLSLINGKHFYNPHLGDSKSIYEVKLSKLPNPFQLSTLSNPSDIAFIDNDLRCEIVITDQDPKEPKIVIYKYSPITGGPDNPPPFKMYLDDSINISKYHNATFQPQEVLVSPWIDIPAYTGNLIFVTATDPDLELFLNDVGKTDVVLSLAYINKHWTITKTHDIGFRPSGMAYQNGTADHSRALFVSSYESQTVTRIPLTKLLP